MVKFCKRFSLNSIYAGKHWSKRSEDKDYWHYLIKAELAKQMVRPSMFEDPVTLTFYWNDNLDCSNHAYIVKMIEDCLKGYFIKDDSRRYVKKIVNEFYDGKTILVDISD
jgi:hypothetical protein